MNILQDQVIFGTKSYIMLVHTEIWWLVTLELVASYVEWRHTQTTRVGIDYPKLARCHDTVPTKNYWRPTETEIVPQMPILNGHFV